MFTHLNNAPLIDLQAETTDNGRYYLAPNGEKYPSVTTVIGAKSKQSILEWRKRVGEKEANRISSRASARGTAMHSMTEDYLNNIFDEEKYKEKVLPLFMFKALKPLLNNINNIHVLEGALYSDRLRLAGRVDCIAEYENELAIIDFKTSTEPKQRGWIENYVAQECAYAMMYYELTGIKVKKLVTLISCENGDVQVFQEYDIKNYMNVLMNYIREWKMQTQS
jgi:ATP-dependent exoDNAse (exonuclease V) beta subunit